MVNTCWPLPYPSVLMKGWLDEGAELCDVLFHSMPATINGKITTTNVSLSNVCQVRFCYGFVSKFE